MLPWPSALLFGIRSTRQCCHCRRLSSATAADAAAAAASAASIRLTNAVNSISLRRGTSTSPGAAKLFAPGGLLLARRRRGADTGLFGIPELRAEIGPVEGFRRLQASAGDTVANLLREALADDDEGSAGGAASRQRPMVRILDDMSDAVCRVADMADCLRQLHPSDDYRTAAEAACVSIATLVESLNTNRRLYQRLCSALRDPGPAGDAVRFGADAVDTRVGELLAWDFLQSGVHLEADSGAAFVAASEKAYRLGARFSREAMRPARLPGSGGGGRELRDPLWDHPSRGVRRAAYEAFYAEMPEQERTLVELLGTRLEIARLAGFASFSDRANSGHLLGDAPSVDRFLAGLADRLAPRVAIDAEAMRRLNGGVEPGAWDFVHLINAATETCFQDSSTAGRSLEEFLSVGACLRGVAHVAECLFGVQLVLDADDDSSDVWDERVFKLSVRRGGAAGVEEELGRIYCDFFPRRGKPAQDCHFTIRGGRQGPPRQLPIVCLQLQCPDPSGGSQAPSLLSPCHVENLFHEFGHAFHSVLGCTRYQHVTGTRCSTDLAEVPSTLMETFAFLPCVLRQYARHWRTGEPLPERLYAPLRASRRVLPAASRQQQVLYAMLDARLHSARPPLASTTAAFYELARSDSMRGLPAYPQGTAWHHRFTHLVGYGAKYHAYLVSKAVASLVWSTRFARDPLCSAAGRDLERRLLSRGGEETTAAMVTELTGRPATEESLAESLVAEVVECQS